MISRHSAVVSSSDRLHSRPAADVHDDAGPVLRVGELLVDQLDQIVDVQQVADLLAGAAEADVAERPAEVVGEQPVA